MGRQIGMVQKFTRIQNIWQNWWWVNGTRVEYFQRIRRIAVCPWSPSVLVKNEHTNRRLHRTDHLHVDVQRHVMESQDNGQECELSVKLVSTFFTRKMVTPRTWIRKEVVFYSWKQHPVFCSTSPLSRGVLKCKDGENYQCTSALTRERLKLFFAQLFLFISSVFTEQSQICVENVNFSIWE